MFKLITIRFKGGSTEYEERQLAAMDKQEELQRQLEEIDKEFYQLRRENKAQYDEQFRPMEESLLRRAAQPATEAMSARARAGEYEAADAASQAANQRRQERYGIKGSDVGTADDDYVRAIALTAVGNTSKDAALQTSRMTQSAALGYGVGVNQDIATGFGRSLAGMQQGLGHADAAFSNFSNAQQHANNAYLARQQGVGALVQSGMAIGQMGISNYQNAAYTQALSGSGHGGEYGTQVGAGSVFSGAPSFNPSGFVGPIAPKSGAGGRGLR